MATNNTTLSGAVEANGPAVVALEKPDTQAPASIDVDNDTGLDEKEGPAKELSEEERDHAHRTKDYVTGFTLVVLMLSVTSTCFLMLLDMSIISTAIPRITTQFHSLPDVGWYGSAYNLSSAALQPLSGKFYSYFKTKWIYLSCLFLFLVGSLICGLATSSTMLILGRAVSGIGSSGIMNGAFTIIIASAPLEKQPSLIGICIGVSQLGLVAGPLIGGALTEYTTWRWCFYINLPIGAVAAALILFATIPDRRVVKGPDATFKKLLPKLDLPGFVLFAPAAIMILLAVQWGGNEHPWKSATVIGLLLGGFGNAVVFVLWERRVGDDAMIPMSIVTKREIWSACVCMMALFASVFTAAFYLPIYFQSVKDATPFDSGVDILPMIMGQLAFAVSGGFLMQKVGYYMPFALAGGVLVSIASGITTLLDPHTSTAKWAGYQLLLGFGRGLTMQVPMIAIQANTKAAMTSVATAILVFSQTFAGALMIAIANAVFTNKLRDELHSRVPSLDAENIIRAGATGIREVVPPNYVLDVKWAYSKGVDATFYISLAGGIILFFAAFGTGWKDIRKKKAAAPTDA